MINGYSAGDPMDHSGEMVRCLEAVDVNGMRRLWDKVRPQFPLHDDAGMTIAIHLSRTQCEAVQFKLRAYSHAWLCERGLPSQLPDNLKPKAQRLYPIIASAVGIAVLSKYPTVKREVTNAMRHAVLEAEADGRLTDDPFVKSRMQEARAYIKKKLYG